MWMSFKNVLAGLTAIIFLSSALVLSGCAGTKTSDSLGENIDDTVITTKVKAKLAESDQTNAFDIGVETFKGVVQLSGFVGSTKESAAAGRLASSVDGVRDVKNNLIVKKTK